MKKSSSSRHPLWILALVGVARSSRCSGPWAKAYTAFAAHLRALQRSHEQDAVVQAFGRADRADDAVDLVSLSAAGRRHRGGDHHQGHVLDVLQFCRPVLAQLVAHQLQRRGQGANRRQEIARIAGAFEAHDQSQALQRVFFLPFDSADVLEQRARLQRRAAGERDEHRQNEPLGMRWSIEGRFMVMVCFAKIVESTRRCE